MSTAKARAAHAKAILGHDLYAQLSTTKVLLVGAGGIGCELLKNIVLTGFGNITLLDLDTIDLSNLNRQFLFKKKDVKQSKALVAAQVASAFNPNVRITPIHGNIKDEEYDIPWFQQFNIVLNALDNLDARRHVNKMCMAAGVPLVESGTAGYLGQVQPILKDRTECFDCISKPTPKTFPVCTIRSTPSQPIHCIVWSKSYLMGQLFGEDEDATGDLDDAEKQGENAEEIATLRKEAQAFKAVRDALRHPTGDVNAARLVFQKVFNADIKNLLIMTDMWRSRSPPIPLDYDAILDDQFVGRPNGKADLPMEESGSGRGGDAKPPNAAPSGGSGLRDQKQLSLKDNLELFISSTNRLATRLRNGEETISFDKDDDDTLDFVTASSNLRSYAYGIEGKTRWEVKEMAGNIIPAIATTNAIISGIIVLQALQLLRKQYTSLRNVHVQFKPSVPLSSINFSLPNPLCGVCRDDYTMVRCDTKRTTLGDVVRGILGQGGGDEDGGERREVSVYEDKRVLSDPDWEDNFESTLESLNVRRGNFLTIVDEDGEWNTIAVGVADLPPDHPADAPPFILPSPLPQPGRKYKPPPPPPQTPPRHSGDKRPLAIEDEDGIIDLEPTPKKPRPATTLPSAAITATSTTISNTTNGGLPTSNGHGHVGTMGGGTKRKFEDGSSPSKRRKLEEDGVVLVDGPDEVLGGADDEQIDYIVIDDD